MDLLLLMQSHAERDKLARTRNLGPPRSHSTTEALECDRGGEVHTTSMLSRLETFPATIIRHGMDL